MATHELLISYIKDNNINLVGDIIEIGSQRRAGRGSSYYLNELAKEVGVRFYTVDFDSSVYNIAKGAVGDAAVNQSGQDFLKSFDGNISVLYLDNYDVLYSKNHAADLRSRIGDHYQMEKGYDFSSVFSQNQQASLVHLEQFVCSLPKLHDHAIIAIDDTKYVKCSAEKFSYFWGKGNTVVPLALQIGFELCSSHSHGCILVKNQ